MTTSGEDKLKRLRIMRTQEKRKRPNTKLPEMRGRWWAEIERSDGSKEVVGPKTNLIVYNAKVLLASLLKGDPSCPDGILYHAVGGGDPVWETSGTPSPSFGQTTLLDEVFRKTPTQIVYIDENTGDPTATKTHIIRIKTVFETTDMDPGGTQIREHGLFGGDASGTVDTGLMIDVIHMESIWKDNTVTITLYIELEL